MTFPTGGISTSHVDSPTDVGDPAAARVELKALIEQFNQLVAHHSPLMAGLLALTTAPLVRGALGAAPISSPSFTDTPTAPTAAVATNTTQLATTAFVRAEIGAYAGHFGQCRLSKSGANLLLLPHNGNRLTIDGVARTVPSGGVTLAPPATSGINYFIYAYMVGAVMTLEASGTAHATDATTGVEIKSGDPSRTLVGMARTVSSAWVDTLQQRFVATWHNRALRSVNNTLKANRTTSSTSAVELSIAGDRAEFLCWAGDVDISHQATAQFTGAGNTLIGWTVLDGSFLTGGSTLSFGAGAGEAFYIGGRIGATVGEGYHYVGIGGQVGTGTALWVSSQCASCASFTG